MFRKKTALLCALCIIASQISGCTEADLEEAADILEQTVSEASAGQTVSADDPGEASNEQAVSEPASAEVSSDDAEEEALYPPLKDAYEDLFRIGVAVQAIDHWDDPTSEIGNPDKEALISREFNSITFANEWKPAYNFDASSPTLYKTNPATKEILNWAKDNGIPVRCHTLVWHSQCDPSIFAKDFKALSKGNETHDWEAVIDEDCLTDSDTLKERLRSYIRGVFEYIYSAGFADTVYAVDVVNEAVEENSSDGLRKSYYYQIIGPEYLYYSFLFAREAELEFARKYASDYGLDPEKDDLSPIIPKLFYNDYNEWSTKRTGIVKRFLTEDAFNEGHRLTDSPAIAEDGNGTITGDGLIDGIGMQGHVDDSQRVDQYIKALRAYDEMVDEVQITELDAGETARGDLADIKQAAFINELFLRLIEERKNGVNLTAVTWWGLTDDASWRKDKNPLIYKGDLTPKPAYKALQLAAQGEKFDMKNP